MKTAEQMEANSENIIVIKKIFDRLGFYGVAHETIETYSEVKTTFDDRPLLAIVLIKDGLERIYRVKFPEYKQGEGKEAYIEKIMSTLIYETFRAVEKGEILRVAGDSISILKMSNIKTKGDAPGISKIFNQFIKLFFPNKN